jgi:hypothetical protein
MYHGIRRAESRRLQAVQHRRWLHIHLASSALSSPASNCTNVCFLTQEIVFPSL